MAETQIPMPRVIVQAAHRGQAVASKHPYNPTSEVHGWTLSRDAGLSRIAVNLAWLPPGRESAAYHLHHREEEWLHVLEGQGVAEVDDRVLAVGPGDFLGFPPGTAHLLRNVGDGDLHFLEGGEVIPDVEVADFPRLGRRMVRYGRHVSVYPVSAEIPFLPGMDSDLPARYLGGTVARAESPRVLVKAADRGGPREYHHPQNPLSEVHLSALSRPAGLKRVAVVHARVPAGKESFAYHVHLGDEEWMYVLSGRGVAEIGDAAHELGPGDFLGFPAGGPAHNARAHAGSDLVYLTGGNAWSRATLDIVDFPRLGLRRTFVGTRDAMTFPFGAALERAGR
jgi:uncharacterized cupin superfamily protein